MHLSLLTALLVIWAAIAGVLVLLMIYRGVLGMHEDDGLYLGEGERTFAQETARSVAQQEQLVPWIRYAGAAVGGISVLIAGVWLYQNWSLWTS